MPGALQAAMEVLAAPLEQSEIDELVPQLFQGLGDRNHLPTRRDSFTLFLCRFEDDEYG